MTRLRSTQAVQCRHHQQLYRFRSAGPLLLAECPRVNVVEKLARQPNRPTLLSCRRG